MKHTLKSFVLMLIASYQLSAGNIKALIIEGTASSHKGSFMALQRNLDSWDFDVQQYVSSNQLGSGLEIHLNELELEDYQAVFVSIHQGTFSKTVLDSFSEYVKRGGHLFIVYQSYPKSYFVNAIEENSNKLLRTLGIEDEVVYQIADADKSHLGSIKLINEDARLVNSSRALRNKLKKENNLVASPFKAMMNPGHSFHRNSKLNQAKSIVEFNGTKTNQVTSVFWEAGNGTVGIGTELNSCAAANTQVYNSWKLIISLLFNQV